MTEQLSIAGESPRILFVLHGYPPKQSAGAEIETERRVRVLEDRGIAVAVLAVDEVGPDAPSSPRLERDGVADLIVWRLSCRLDEPWGDSAEYEHPAVSWALDQVAAEFSPTHVHVISGYRGTAAAIQGAAERGLSVVVTATDYWFACPRITLTHVPDGPCGVPDDPWACGACLANERRRYRMPHQLTGGRSSRALSALARRGWPVAPDLDRYGQFVSDRRVSLRRALSRADAVLAASSSVAGVLDDVLGHPGMTRTMRQGLDTSSWRSVIEGDRALDQDGSLRIGFIGQLAPHKGVFDLVGAMRSLRGSARPLSLSIHGDPAAAWRAHRQQLEGAIETDTRITLVGPFDNRDIRNVHAGIDVLVVPSRWYENSPNVILEAFACGTPVITANLGGMAELVEDGVNGLLFEPGDVKDLARCLRRVAEEPELLDRLRAGIPPVRTIEDEMDELLALYRDVAAERHSAPQPVEGAA